MTNSETPISPVGESKPELTISAASINNEPVELDSTPTSPEYHRGGRRGSKPTLEELSPEEREKKAKLLSERKGDPAVLVDIPQTPTAEEYGKSDDPESKGSDKSTNNTTASQQ